MTRPTPRLGGLPRAIGTLSLLGVLACGPHTAMERAGDIAKATEVVDSGGSHTLEGRLSFRSAEAMAIQEVPYQPGAEGALLKAYQRYQGQWTFLLTVGPRATTKPDPQNPLAYDIENNGGVWGDHSRNLQRLMFEMGDFIHLKTPAGAEVKPVLVEFQRTFGMGLDRSFLVIFPKTWEGKPLKPPFDVRVHEFGQGLGLLEFHVAKGPSEMGPWRLKRHWKASAESNF